MCMLVNHMQRPCTWKIELDHTEVHLGGNMFYKGNIGPKRDHSLCQKLQAFQLVGCLRRIS